MMKLTVKDSDSNTMGAVVMNGEVPVALCRPLQIFAKGKDGALVSNTVTKEEAIRNAHLFSAVPDLLLALQGLLRVADRDTDEFNAAREAIAKALGFEQGVETMNPEKYKAGLALNAKQNDINLLKEQITNTERILAGARAALESAEQTLAEHRAKLAAMPD